jgi:hypothetical protein
MTGKKLLLGVVVLLVASLVLGGIAGCCPAGEEPVATPTAPAETPTAPAETPTTPAGGGAAAPATGDTWTYTVTYEQAALGTLVTTFTATVSSASAAGYEVDIAFDETLRKEKVSGLNLDTRLIAPMIRTYNADLDETAMEVTIDPSGFGENPFGSVSTYTYPSPKFPLTVGAEWTREFVYHVGDILERTEEHTWTVEAMESVTVPAGTFDCYKIVDTEGGDVLMQLWFAEEVKAPVKRVENIFWAGEETWELESYSVAP